MKKYQQILAGVDFSPACRAAVAAAARLASYDGGQVTVLHVMDPVLAGEIKQAHKFTDAQVFSDMKSRVRKFLADTEIGTDQMNVEIDMGHPFVGIVNACNRLHTDLVVLGAHGTKHGANQIGAMAAKCVRKAPADVLLIREHVSGPFKKVLACVDLSQTSARAVLRARKVAENDGAQLDCLYVFQSALALSLDYGGYRPALSPGPSSETLESWKLKLEAFLGPLLHDALAISWRGLVEERSNVRATICDYIQALKMDLVVLGTRGKTDLRTIVMGTTAEKIVSHAPCSVLAVKPEGFEYSIQ